LGIQHFFKIFFRLALIGTLLPLYGLKAQLTTDLNYSLEEKWLKYDWEAGVFTNFIPKIHKNVQSLTILIDTEKYTDKSLHLSHTLPLDVFINNKLLYNTDPDNPLDIEINQLKTLAEENEVSISIYSETSYRNIPVIYLSSDKTLSNNYYSFDIDVGAVKRNRLLYEKNQLFWLVLGVVILISTVHSHSNPVFRIFSLEGLRSIFVYNKSGVDKKFNISNVFIFLGLISLIYAISFSMLNNSDGILGFAVNALENDILFLGINNRFVITCALLLSIFCIKLLLIWFTGQLFNLNNGVTIHINEYILLSQVFSLIIFFLIILHGFYPQIIDKQVLVFFLSYSFIIVSIGVTIKVYGLLSFKNVFIISYFCITEFIPALIMFRLF